MRENYGIVFLTGGQSQDEIFCRGLTPCLVAAVRSHSSPAAFEALGSRDWNYMTGTRKLRLTRNPTTLSRSRLVGSLPPIIEPKSSAWIRDMPAHPSLKLQKKLASVDHTYATPHQFLDALDAAIGLPKKTRS